MEMVGVGEVEDVMTTEKMDECSPGYFLQQGKFPNFNY